jgi:hypothetical protein
MDVEYMDLLFVSGSGYPPGFFLAVEVDHIGDSKQVSGRILKTATYAHLRMVSCTRPAESPET